jgi:hypothetical protein
MASVLRTIYRWTAFLALPGIFWAAFEMYGLTLLAQQMLFFSINHTMPPLILAVFLAVPVGALWLGQSVLALMWRTYRIKLSLSFRSLAIFIAALLIQTILLWSYDDWTRNDAVRVAISIFGISVTAVFAYEVWTKLCTDTENSAPEEEMHA